MRACWYKMAFSFYNAKFLVQWSTSTSRQNKVQGDLLQLPQLQSLSGILPQSYRLNSPLNWVILSSTKWQTYATQDAFGQNWFTPKLDGVDDWHKWRTIRRIISKSIPSRTHRLSIRFRDLRVQNRASHGLNRLARTVWGSVNGPRPVNKRPFQVACKCRE